MWSIALSVLFVLETMAAKSTNDRSPTMTRRRKVSRFFFSSLQSDRTARFWGYCGQVARISVQRHLDACELGDFWCSRHPSYPRGGTQRSQKKCRGGIQATQTKDYHERVRITLIKHGTPRVRWQRRWKGGCWSTARAANWGRTAKVDQKTKCNRVRFLICACPLFLNSKFNVNNLGKVQRNFVNNPVHV